MQFFIRIILRRGIHGNLLLRSKYLSCSHAAHLCTCVNVMNSKFYRFCKSTLRFLPFKCNAHKFAGDKNDFPHKKRNYKFSMMDTPSTHSAHCTAHIGIILKIWNQRNNYRRKSYEKPKSFMYTQHSFDLSWISHWFPFRKWSYKRDRKKINNQWHGNCSMLIIFWPKEEEEETIRKCNEHTKYKKWRAEICNLAILTQHCAFESFDSGVGTGILQWQNGSCSAI